MWQDFSNLQNQVGIFDSYQNYFNALVGWVKKYEEEINNQHEQLFVRSGLTTILEVDIEKYLSKKPEISLELEIQRMFTERPKHIYALLREIGDTLWGLVRFDTEKGCPCCMGAGLNYVLAIAHNTKEKKVILECETCGYSENVDGSKYTDGFSDIYPVNDDDLVKYGVDCKKSFE